LTGMTCLHEFHAFGIESQNCSEEFDLLFRTAVIIDGVKGILCRKAFLSSRPQKARLLLGGSASAPTSFTNCCSL
jgi:hypothetical protein